MAGLRMAALFDGVDPQGRPVIHRQAVDPAIVDRLRHYLRYAPVVMAARSRGVDDFTGVDRDVPLSFHTDGVFVWAGAVPHYLGKYGLPPDPALLAHIVSRDFTLGEVDDAVRQAAADLVMGGGQQPPG